MRVDGHASTELLSRLARDNLDAGRTAPPTSMIAPASGLAVMPSAEIGQDAARGQTAGFESGATRQFPAPVRAPAPTGRELVRAIQERLSDRGYYDGPLDGNLGPKTRQAIQVYQRVQRYQTTGRPTRVLYEELEDYALEAQGLRFFQKGSYDAAIATYTQIIQRSPKSADHYFNRGLAHKILGRTGQALSNYETALALDPAHRRAYLNRANILYDQGLYVAAVRDYFKVLKLLLSFS
jgi:tetratricopeptide (TPR) repeat protein